MAGKVAKNFETGPGGQINSEVAPEALHRRINPHDAANEKLRRAADLTYDKDAARRLPELRRLIMSAMSDVRDGKARR